VPLSAVRDISSCLDPATGRVVWDAPEGSWRLLRVGYAPNMFGWGGCYIDHMSRAAFDEHWRLTMEPLLSELAPDERTALKGVMCDSWEAGTVSWTQTFPEEFAKRRGYDVRAWLPARAGIVLEGVPKTARFLRDFNETISELIADNHYAYQREGGEPARACLHRRGGGPPSAPGRCAAAVGPLRRVDGRVLDAFGAPAHAAAALHGGATPQRPHTSTASVKCWPNPSPRSTPIGSNRPRR
jgi:hypothetical protein